MTALTRNPTNTNPLLVNKFQISFTRLPNLTYFCQTVNLPGISLGEIQRATPFVELYHPDDKLIYESLNFSFIIDEDLNSWLEIHDWMRAMTFPKNFSEYQNLPKISKFSKKGFPQYSDATLQVLTSKFNLNYNIHYYNCFPTSLSGINFSSMDSPENTLTADVTFRYDYFDIEKV